MRVIADGDRGDCGNDLSMSKTGRFIGLPYDWRKPSKARIKSRAWDPSNPRLFVPKAYGWGYSLNFARLFRRRARSTR